MQVREYDKVRFTGEVEFYTDPGLKLVRIHVRRLLCVVASLDHDRRTIYKVWPLDLAWARATACEGKAYPVGKYRVQPYSRRLKRTGPFRADLRRVLQRKTVC
jgi:hypothetical protein